MVERGGSSSIERYLRPSEQLAEELGMQRVPAPEPPRGPLPVLRSRRAFLAVTALTVGGVPLTVFGSKAGIEHAKLLSQQANALYPRQHAESDVSHAKSVVESVDVSLRNANTQAIQKIVDSGDLNRSATIAVQENYRQQQLDAYRSEHRDFRYWRDLAATSVGVAATLTGSLTMLWNAAYYSILSFQKPRENGQPRVATESS